jgi:hypothetical protein
MRILTASVACLLLSLGCSGPDIHYDYDAKTRFPDLHSYDWYAPDPSAQAQAWGVKNPFMDARVRRAVESVLAEKHFQKETVADPDFLVTYYPAYGPRWVGPGQVGVGMAFGFRGPGLGVGVAGPVGGPDPHGAAGAIVLEIKDARTRELLWRAEAEDVLDASESPEEADHDVAVAVKRMLDRFPPS